MAWDAKSKLSVRKVKNIQLYFTTDLFFSVSHRLQSKKNFPGSSSFLAYLHFSSTVLL